MKMVALSSSILSLILLVSSCILLIVSSVSAEQEAILNGQIPSNVNEEEGGTTSTKTTTDSCSNIDNDSKEQQCNSIYSDDDDTNENINTTTTLSSGPYYTAFDSASWAITSKESSKTKIGPHVQELYDKFIKDCNAAVHSMEGLVHHSDALKNKDGICGFQDEYRIKMNSEQPGSVYNYTKEGYKKIKCPEELLAIVKEFWESNRDRAEIEWKDYNVYHNAWESPPTIAHLNQARTGGSKDLQAKIWELVKPVLQNWTGHYLSPVSLYGIRVYHDGSILTPHVDRMPLITSAISKFCR
jgi:hypothetical protein